MSEPPSTSLFSPAMSGITVTPYPQDPSEDPNSSIQNSKSGLASSTNSLSPSKKKQKKKKQRKKAKSTISSDGNMRPISMSVSKGPKKLSPLVAPISDEELAKLSHSDRLKRWIALMKLEERQQIVSIIDPSLSDLLLSMDQKLAKEGHGLFYEVGESSSLEEMMLGAIGIHSSRNRSSSLSTSSVAVNQRLQGFRAANRNKSHSVNSSSSSSSSSSSGRGKRGNQSASAAQRGNGLKGLTGLKFFDDFFMGMEIKRPDRDENFCFLKNSRLSEYFTINSLLRSDEELHHAVRLCDTTQYLDTITLASSLLRGTAAARFFRTMRIASRGKFLESPCKLAYDPKTKKWSAEQPKWFKTMGYYTFGTFLAQKIESLLWMRYWRAHNIDPRVDPQSPPQLSPTQLQSVLDVAAGGAARFQQQLLSKIHLVQYLQRLSQSEKKGIILNIGRAVKEVVRENLTSTNYPHLLSILLTFASPAPRMLSNLDLSSSTTFMKEVNNEGEFIEVVFFSPLPRADTGMDLVLRRIGVFLQTSYTNKLHKDLILGEEMEKQGGKKKQQHQQQQRQQKTQNAKSATADTQASNKVPKPQPEPSQSSSSLATTTASASVVAVAESSLHPTPRSPPIEVKKAVSITSPPTSTAAASTSSPSSSVGTAASSAVRHASPPRDSLPPIVELSPTKVDITTAPRRTARSSSSTPTRSVIRVGVSHEAPEQRSFEREQTLQRITRQAESDNDDDASNPWQTRFSRHVNPRPATRTLSGSYQGTAAMRRKAKEAENALPSKGVSSRLPPTSQLDFSAQSSNRRIQIFKWATGPSAGSVRSTKSDTPPALVGMIPTSDIAVSPAHSQSSSPRGGAGTLSLEPQEKRGRTMSQPIATQLPTTSKEHAVSAPTTPVPSPRGWATVSAPSISRTTQSQGASEERGRKPRRPSADSVAATSWRNAVAPVTSPPSAHAAPRTDTIARAKSQELELEHPTTTAAAPSKQPPTKSKSHGKLDLKHVRTKSNPSSSSSSTVATPASVATQTSAPSSTSASSRTFGTSPSQISPSSSNPMIASTAIAPGVAHHVWSTKRQTPQYGRYAWLASQSMRSRGRHAQQIYPSGSISGTATPLAPLDPHADSDESDPQRRRSHSPPPRFRSPYPPPPRQQMPQDAEFYVLGKEYHYAPGGFLPLPHMYLSSQSLPIPIHRSGSMGAGGGGHSPASSPSMSPSSNSSASSASSFTAMLSMGLHQNQVTHHPFMAGIAFGIADPTAIHPCGQQVRFSLPKRKTTVAARLDADIRSFVEQIDSVMEPKQEQLQKTLLEIRSLVKSVWPSSNIRVELYGSYATNLSIPSSDVDIVICDVNEASEPDISPLLLLEQALKTQAWVQKDTLVSIESAAVPVIKFVSNFGQLPVDITFEDLAVHHTGCAARDRVLNYVASYPHLRHLTLVLKQLLQYSSLNNAYKGGLSSYCLVLMIISFIQEYHPSTATTQTNLGEALLDFLDIYGHLFVYDRMYVGVKTEKSMPPSHCYGLGLENIPLDEGPLAPLSIIDPVRENNVLGKQTDSMFIVRLLFQDLLTHVQKHYAAADESFEPGKLHRVISEAKPAPSKNSP